MCFQHHFPYYTFYADYRQAFQRFLLFNMGPDEAAACAALIGAKHNILIHPKPGESIRRKAEKWNAANKLVMEPGQEIEL